MLVVLGAKGGVGATTVAWQLSQALMASDGSPLAIDAHLWQPDLARVAGVELRPGASLLDVVSGEAAPADAVRVGDGPALVPGSWLAVPSPEAVANLGAKTRQTIGSLPQAPDRATDRFDTLVVDGGPGRTPWAPSLIAAADLVLLVTTPEPFSLMSAYSLIKSASDAGAAPPLKLVVNRCSGEAHARASHAGVRDTCRRHLGASPPLAGWLPDDPRLGRPAAEAAPLARPLCRRVRASLSPSAEGVADAA